MRPIIRAEGLGKQYRIGGRGAPYATLRESLTRAVRAPWRRLRGAGEARENTFWALKDVNFEVRPGEVLGVVGRNGAGKSTLLKVLSRITEPTAGRVELYGRVGSLLEVGTGFHPELTGRENVYLNGTILGMRRREIQKKFDEIVAFAEVERFLDTPVKHYSSGMYVRLAFAVAAHLEPEILIIDEVLAVGDVAFQRKCLGVMKTVAKTGRTVLFVSHNMQAVRTLCDSVVLLESGEIVDSGPSHETVNRYLGRYDGETRGSLEDTASVLAAFPPDPTGRLLNITVTQNGRPAQTLLTGHPIEIAIDYDIYREAPGFHAYITVLDPDGTLLFDSLDNGAEPEPPVVRPGRYTSRVTIPPNFLAPRVYEILVNAGMHNVRAIIPRPIRLVVNLHASGEVNRAYPGYQTPGRLAPLLEWKIERHS